MNIVSLVASQRQVSRAWVTSRCRQGTYPPLVLVSWGWCNKLPRIGLKTAGIYSLAVLEAGGQQSGNWQNCAPCGGSGEDPFLASSSLWGSQWSLLCGCFIPFSVSVSQGLLLCVWLSGLPLLFFYKDNWGGILGPPG